MKNSLFKDILTLRVVFCREDRSRFGWLLALMFFGSFLEAIGIGIIPGFVAFLMNPSSLSKVTWLGDWVHHLPEEPTLRLMIFASLLFVGFVVFKALFLSFVYYAQSRIVSGFRVRLSCRMFSAYQSAPYEWLLQRSTSELQRNILNDTQQVVVGVIMPFLDLIMAFLMTLFIVVAMLISTSPITLLATGIIGGGTLLVIHSFRRHLKRIGVVLREEGKNIIQAIQQGFGALIDSRIVGCETYLEKRFRRSITIQSRMAVFRVCITKSTPLAIEAVALVGLLVILLLIMSGEGSFGDAIPVMSVLGVATIRLKQLAGRLALQFNSLNASRAYISGVVKDIHELGDLSRKVVAPSGDVGIDRFHSLELRRVVYKYPNMDNSAVKDISLVLKRGESIAFVGSTGCGKSTLLNLILGLLEPCGGDIKVNGENIFSVVNQWRKFLGYIPQSIFLLDDSIRANIAFGVSQDAIDDGRLVAALKSACLSEFVDGLPDGLDTVVGERGVRLSGGQRQRIGIARALYFDPEVLVMDEATSALDNKTESEVMVAISNLKKDRTVIMVAHRLSTVEKCDRLYHLEDGRIVDQGSYEELIKKSKNFRALAVKSA